MGISNYVPNSRLAQPGVCTSTTRPATPYEGQVIYETDTNRVLVWDASAWVMIADTDQPPGMQLIKTDTITSGSSKEITGVFSADFKNYKIMVSNFASSVDFGLKMQMGTTATGVYYFASNTVSYTGTASTDSVSAGTDWNIRAVASSLKASATIDLFSPYQAIQTSFASQATDVRTNGIGTNATTGFINNTTSYTSFTFLVGANTFTSCDIAVYGYRN